MSFISSVMTFIVCIVSLIPVALNLQEKTYSPVYPDKIKLNAVLIADTHTDGDILRDRNNVLRRSLGALAGSKAPIDALVFAGDITNAGAEIEYRNLNRMLKYLDKSNQLIPELGNHDSGGTSDDKTFENECILFQQFCKTHGIETEKNYYYKTVNDYFFIVMGTEKMLENEAYISDVQLKWLDDTLTLAQNEGKIAFVICHQPLHGTNGISDDLLSGACVGEQSPQIKEIIKRHTDSGLSVLFVSGHLHNSFSNASFETVSKGFYCLNLPSFLYSNGIGVIMEVYKDEVLLKAHDFINNNDETCYKISLTDDVK